MADDVVMTTDKVACNVLADLLEKHGVSRVVMSPGSRNAPLVVALSRRQALKCISIIDERTAAFIALGMAIQSGRPVALVCTSGTAMLNYAPAVAEAYYRCVPLIVVSADRPRQWIDQDDSQTLRQPGALSHFVKESYDLPADLELMPDGQWLANRLINDALLLAMSRRCGPVHINVRLDAPLSCDSAPYQVGSARSISELNPSPELSTARARELGCELASPRRVMVVAGFSAPDAVLNRALGRLAALPNVAVLTESIANLHNPLFVNRIDATLATMTDAELQQMSPDVVITTGGALVSRHIKEYLRSRRSVEHWHVGYTDTTIDCFRHLTLKVEMEPGVFFRQLASAMQPHRASCSYAERWQRVARRGAAAADTYAGIAPWSDMSAFSLIFPMIPRRWNVHLSNGTAIRYAQLFDCTTMHRCECNRGVSGIDGSTATAIGASMAYDSGCTLLISGDMSARYDLGSLFTPGIPPQFKMIIMDNDGGGIFRFIGSTAALPELEQRFACAGVATPWRAIAEAAGWRCFTVGSERQLRDEFPDFCDEKATRPSLMVVTTPPQSSAEILKNYFRTTRP